MKLPPIKTVLDVASKVATVAQAAWTVISTLILAALLIYFVRHPNVEPIIVPLEHQGEVFGEKPHKRSPIDDHRPCGCGITDCGCLLGVDCECQKPKK